MAEPGDHKAAAAGGRGRLRASHADREQAIEALKDAFAQGRLTGDDLDSRVGQALASQTYAELTALTDDLPAGPAAAPPPCQPARTHNRAPGDPPGAERSHRVGRWPDPRGRALSGRGLAGRFGS